MSEQAEKFKVTIDNISIEVAPGTTVLQAAREIGGDVTPPAMCYYSKLEGSGGKCRTCLVEVSKGSDRDERPMPKLMASCRTQVMDGMEVKNITSERVKDARAGVVEFLLMNHPLDCPICDQAGECHLQDLGYEHGAEGTRYEFDRRTFKKEDFGPYIQLHMTRCILCYRCTYVADQLTDSRGHGIVDRGDHAAISTYIEKAVDNDFSGNMIDVCPVGALTDRTFRFKNRVWFTKPVYAHRDCDKCCGEVTLWKRGENVLRATARKDQWGEVKDSNKDGKPGWICNTCRFDKKETADWTIEGPAEVSRHSVINQGHYSKDLQHGEETMSKVMKGRKPKLLMDIHDVSEVNKQGLINMLERLKKKWKVTNLDLFLIFCVFGITGSTTAYITKVITKWVGVAGSATWSSDWWIGIGLRIGMLIFGYQVIILLVSIPFGQFKFFLNYEKKILRKMGLMKKEDK